MTDFICLISFSRFNILVFCDIIISSLSTLFFTVLLLFLDSACISRLVPFCNILPNVELLSVRDSRVLLSELASLYPVVLHFDANGIFNEVSSLLLNWVVSIIFILMVPVSSLHTFLSLFLLSFRVFTC